MAPEKRSMLQLDLKNVIAAKSVFAAKKISSLSKTGAIVLICIILATFFILKFDLFRLSVSPYSDEASQTQVSSGSLPDQKATAETRKPLITPLSSDPRNDPTNDSRGDPTNDPMNDPNSMGQEQDTTAPIKSEKDGGILFAIGQWFTKLSDSDQQEPPQSSSSESSKEKPALLKVGDQPDSQSDETKIATEPETATEESSSDVVQDTPVEPKPEPERKSKRYLDKQADMPWRTATVKKNDTLSQIFKRNGVGIVQSYQIAELEGAEALLKIKPGQKIQFKRNDNEELLALRYRINKLDTLTIYRTEEGFEVDFESRQPQIRLNSAKATIWNSLLETAEIADISFNTMYDFITLFGWQIDFAKDIRSGDQFSIIYEEKYLDGEKISNGRIVAAEMIASKKRLRAVRHADEHGNIEYYAPNGDGVKGSFLRTPIKFGRVTSKFTSKRLHPIKKTWRAHKGVDYGAPRGTPVLATGDGVVRHAENKGGYGKTVVIRHGGKYDTLYAHLNKTAKGVRRGSRVKQGQVIGYVGSTGLATGPHLHYEFRIHGIHKDPLTVELPKSSPIDDKYKTNFLKIASVWADKLDQRTTPALVDNQTGE